MKVRNGVRCFAILTACIASFVLGRESVWRANRQPECPSAENPKDSETGAKAFTVRLKNLSDDEAVEIGRNAVAGIYPLHLEESVVLSSGHYKLVSFRIWRNPNDSRPHGPETWHSPVWIDTENGAVIPPQLTDWEPLSDSRLKNIVTEWDRALRDGKAENWTWTVEHVSGFAKVVVRDPAPPPDNIWVEDGDPFAVEYWVDETRKAVICAMEI